MDQNVRNRLLTLIARKAYIQKFKALVNKMKQINKRCESTKWKARVHKSLGDMKRKQLRIYKKAKKKKQVRKKIGSKQVRRETIIKQARSNWRTTIKL